MKSIQLLMAVVVGAAASVSYAAPLAANTFDEGAEGWKAENGARNFEWIAEGGDPGGFVRARDISSQSLWFFSAPSQYLGDQLAAYGGTLSFALMSGVSSPPLPGSYADVQLLGENGVRLAFHGGAHPDDSWTTYSIALVADGSWKVGSVNGVAATLADFESVLSNLRELRIRGDYKQAVESTGLDAVSLEAAPVPEPGTAVFLLAGLGLLALRSKQAIRRML